MRAEQLLVNELASPPGLPFFCTPEPTRSLAGGIWGERKGMVYSISAEPQETQLEFVRFRLPAPHNLSSRRHELMKCVKEDLKVTSLPTVLTL